MKFRRILLSLVLLAAASLSAASRPNVVFLLTDDLGYRGYKLPANQAGKNELLQQMARLAGIDPSTPNLGSRVTNTTFSSPEYKRLKSEFVRLRTFQEAWIPAIKSGGFSRFALYDLKADPLQKKDISKQRPEVTNRLKKKLLTLYKDVMADAPDWKAE